MTKAQAQLLILVAATVEAMYPPHSEKAVAIREALLEVEYEEHFGQPLKEKEA